jgi:hypothetical protein
VENVRATNTGNAIFLRLGHRNKTDTYSQLQNVVIRNVSVEVETNKPHGFEYQEMNLPPLELSASPSASASPKPVKASDTKASIRDNCPSSIVGLPGHPVRNVRLENVTIIYPGPAVPDVHYISSDKLNSVPEVPAQYPDFWMFGKMPAWGFYVRHAEGIEFSNVCIMLRQPDFRPAVVFDDVSRMNVDQLAVTSAPHDPVVVLQDVRDADFKRLSFPETGSEAIKIQGKCEKIEGISFGETVPPEPQGDAAGMKPISTKIQ